MANIKVSDMTALTSLPDDALLYVVLPNGSYGKVTKAEFLSGIAGGTTPTLQQVTNASPITTQSIEVGGLIITGKIAFVTSLITSLRSVTFPDKNGTVAYLDDISALLEGISWKQPVEIAFDTAVSQSGVIPQLSSLTNQGVTLVDDSRVILMAQANPVFNGIYRVSSTPVSGFFRLYRTNDANTTAELNNAVVGVTSGTFAGKTFRQTAVNPTIGTTAINFVEFGNSSVANATDVFAGITKIYNAIGTQTDGGITPNAVKIGLDSKVDKIENHSLIDDQLIPLIETAAQRDELGAAAFSNDYNDLDNLPTIPSIAGLATESYVNNATDKLSYITITQPVNLDEIETRVNELDAAVVLKGTWNNESGFFPSGAQTGWSYLVTTNGTIDGVEFASGDRLICVLDNASTTTYAGNWYKADYTDRVNTVAGRTGNVVITSSDLSDFNSAVNALITTALASFKTANFLDFTSSGQTQLNGKSHVIFSDGVTASGIAVATEQKLKSYLIPANSIADGSILLFNTRLVKTPAGGAVVTLRVYVNTSDTLVGATLIGFVTASGTTGQEIPLQRTITIKGSNLMVLNTTVNASTDLAFSNTNPSSIQFNRTVNQFLIISGQSANSAIVQITMANLIKN